MVDQPDPQWEDEPTNSVPAIPRTTLLIALAALGASAVVLAILRAAQQRRHLDQLVAPSMEHFAGAIEIRLAGMQTQIDELRTPVGRPHPVDVPVPVADNGNGDAPIVERERPPETLDETITGEHGITNEPPAPPRGAAVSLPDGPAVPSAVQP